MDIEAATLLYAGTASDAAGVSVAGAGSVTTGATDAGAPAAGPAKGLAEMAAANATREEVMLSMSL